MIILQTNKNNNSYSAKILSNKKDNLVNETSYKMLKQSQYI